VPEISDELLDKIQKCHVQSTPTQEKLRKLYAKLMNNKCSRNTISDDAERALNKYLDKLERAQTEVIEEIPD